MSSTTKKISFDGNTARFYPQTQKSEALNKPTSFSHPSSWGGRALLYNLRHESPVYRNYVMCLSRFAWAFSNHHVLFNHPLAYLILDFSTYYWFLIVFWVYKWLDKYFGLDKLHEVTEYCFVCKYEERIKLELRSDFMRCPSCLLFWS